MQPHSPRLVVYLKPCIISLIILSSLRLKGIHSARKSNMPNPLINFTTIVRYLLVISHLTHHVIATMHSSCWPLDESTSPLIFKECFNIISQDVARGRDLNLPLKFSPDSSLEPDILLPATWSGGTSNCIVGLAFEPGRTGYDRVSMLDIKRAATAIGLECVIKPPHRGGILQIGWYDKMGLVLVSKEPSRRGKNGTLSIE